MKLESSSLLEVKKNQAAFDVEKLKGRDLFIKGIFDVLEPSKGMFIFKDAGVATVYGSGLVEDKIGVFIDVYNFQPIMNTVELILIDPADSYNSQMYFEEFGNKER